MQGMLAPVSAVVVVADDAGQGVEHHGVLPAGPLHEQAAGRAAEELGGALRWRRQAEALAGSGDGHRVVEPGFEGDEVRHA